MESSEVAAVMVERFNAGLCVGCGLVDAPAPDAGQARGPFMCPKCSRSMGGAVADRVLALFSAWGAEPAVIAAFVTLAGAAWRKWFAAGRKK